MLIEHKNKATIGIGFGLVLQIVTNIFGEALGGLSPVALLASTILLLYGSFNYAKGKGYSQWLGLLGIFSILGIFVLVLLKDKHKTIADAPK